MNCLNPFTNTNSFHNNKEILKIKDVYDTSLPMFLYRNLEGDCQLDSKEYFIKRNSQHITRQAGNVDNCSARIEQIMWYE